MTTVLGLDSGGTKTLAVVADGSGNILRHWIGPGFDPMAGDRWISDLTDAVSYLCADENPVAAVLGLPFHGEIADASDRQIAAARSVFACPHLVLNDVEVACDGAFAGEDGVLLLAGTGSMAWAKVGMQSLRTGGWGEAFGDEGSAYWIGREALSLASQTLDGRIQAPEFAAAMLETCGTDRSGLLAWAYGQENPRASYAALAVQVSMLAEANNGAARDLLSRAVRYLGDHIIAVRRLLERPELAWSYAGGLFQSSYILKEARLLLGEPLLPKLPPVGGALWRAAALAGSEPGDDFIRSLGASLEKLSLVTGAEIQ